MGSAQATKKPGTAVSSCARPWYNTLLSLYGTCLRVRFCLLTHAIAWLEGIGTLVVVWHYFLLFCSGLCLARCVFIHLSGIRNIVSIAHSRLHNVYRHFLPWSQVRRGTAGSHKQTAYGGKNCCYVLIHFCTFLYLLFKGYAYQLVSKPLFMNTLRQRHKTSSWHCYASRFLRRR